MNLFPLISIIEKVPDFNILINKLKRGMLPGLSLQAPEQAYSYLAAAIHHSAGMPLLLLTAHPEVARRRIEQLTRWVSTDSMPVYFPEEGLFSAGNTPDPLARIERIKVLARLTRATDTVSTSAIPSFIVTNVVALTDVLPDNDIFRAARIEISVGTSYKLGSLLEKLQSSGYAYDNVVEVPGTYGRRGGIIDVYPADSDYPVRIEYLGNQIDNMRLYDAKTQRSGRHIMSVIIPPFVLPSTTGEANLLDYLPEKTVILAEDMRQLEAEVTKIEKEQGIASGDIYDRNGRSNNKFLGWPLIQGKLRNYPSVLDITPWAGNDQSTSQAISLNIKPAPGFAPKLQVFLDRVRELRSHNRRLVIVSQQAERLNELLSEERISAGIVENVALAPGENSITILRDSLDGGWCLSNELMLLSDLELFGIIKQRRTTKALPVRHHRFLNDINIGDYVVHIEHGIARFAGVKKMTVDEIEREYFILEFAGTDVLYVPVEQVDRLSLYLGSGDAGPKLSRLGSQEWNHTRQKVKESVAEIAGELIQIYAAREAIASQPYSADTLWQQELEASFPYVETNDQLEAVQAVKADMESIRPMDRLICGDVGYGKTEIAIRAAFKAVMGGKQVVMLVPTTILAQQHLNTFNERLRAFPIKVAMLSRFCSPTEQAETVAKLKEGTVDICIGTHRLLQKDVLIKDLGLVIIDEEQRFGVAHKEHFKKMRKSVDVLTLSATPIPRTLHMSLSGIRDMSIIQTPPESRLPVVTRVGEFKERLVRDAILREVERDGQVFVVHNRVHSIGMVSEKIGKLVPEVSIAIAHGQMDENRLEQVMRDFLGGQIDVLVTTTIIESGLDMPNVNTLIVNESDKLGLTQLYQLRGRVGRGANIAYAYFLFDSGKELAGQARERLKTIAQTAELGAGYAIAMKDMEIRGAGSLLGVEQSGHIAAVGFNYYCQLLAEAVQKLKVSGQLGEATYISEQPALSIDLHIPAFIPEGYIEDMRTRFNFYQRLASLNRYTEVIEVERELLDRFGDLPGEVTNLLFAVGIKQFAYGKGIESILRRDNQIVITFDESADTQRIFPLMAHRRAVSTGNKQMRVNIAELRVNWRKELADILESLAA